MTRFTLDQKPLSLIEPFYELCNKPMTGYVELTRQLIKHYRVGGPNPLEFLLTQWMESRNNREPNYSVYGSPYYLAEGYACWAIYSRTALRNIRKRKQDLFGNEVQSILDIGNGIGLSTVNLREIFPDAEIYANNFEDSEQWKINQQLQKQCDFTLLNEDIESLVPVDLLFASEYFEHIRYPIEHLEQLIEQINPKYMIIGNSFNTIGIGHFEYYYHHGREIHESKMSRMFNKYLRNHGYELMKPTFFNNTPAVWTRSENQLNFG